MSERVVKIKLEAEATGVVQGFNRAKDAAGELKNKVTESARSQRAEWATVGAGLTAVGVAVTGIGLAALKTGVQYNTLQQTTRAALTSLLGSAQAANQQMDKLDDFARNSPFSKATFISAQQQMLAFGIEAKKVIPYLDGVQNAVAAAGGSNADIEGIVATMSKIQSSSKITATDLMEFGNRGVNAAELIGSQMGKTGAQIREDITAGALSAEDALDALVAGMSTKFDGAAANVKNTFAGSLDRVRAAWRDFSAELAKPLVDPNGGGALVDLLNWTADMMRAFQDLPEPIQLTISGLTGAAGATALAGGALMLALPKFLEFKSALKDLGGLAGLAKGGLSGIVSFLTSNWAVGLVAAAAAMVVFNKAVEAGKTPQTEFSAALKETNNLVDALQIATRDTKSNYWTDGFRESLKDLPGLMDRVIESNKNFMLMTGFSDAKALENLKQMGVELATIAQTDFASVQKSFVELAAGMDELQVEELLNQMPELRAQFANAAADIGLSASAGSVLALAMGDIDYAAEKSAQSLEGIAGVATDTTEAISKLADEISNFGKAQIDSDRAAIALQDKIRALNQIVSDGAAELGFLTEAGGKTESAFLDIAEAAKTSASTMWKAGESVEGINAVLDDARQKLIDQRVALGEDAAAAEAWASARVPTAESVRQALEGVKGAADSIPKDSKANVSTDADAATGKLKGTKGAQDQIRPSVNTTVTADTSAAMGPLEAVGAWLDRIASGAHATITTSGGSTGGGSAGGGGTGGSAGGRAYGGTIGFAGGGTIGGIGGGVFDGTVYGRGGSKSDSINVNLSRGEEVIQEPYASMNRPLLKAINRGDFVAGRNMQQKQTVIVREIGDVYVQNPVTGRYLLAQMGDVANSAIDSYAQEQAQADRRARY